MCGMPVPFITFPPKPKINCSFKKMQFGFSQKWLQRYCEFIECSNPINMTLLAFPGEIPKLEKYFLIFYPSINVSPKPID